ncbi:hypothetical protein Ddye_021624 [Dipteronia dyeriana]|uniref:Legume lectin domain-containing protein n=1 Tax=Dipteronia dyeriana TaxID=168575 RepID=A0AAD9U312_9ROSI|nr:hypothetical protein Ddye_021624 [Dipteronia dyeriana]
MNRSRDASISPDGFLSLAKNQADKSNGDSVGRAVYAKEMHLWDAGTGLISNCEDFDPPESPIVAVEFDTFKNSYDSSNNHVVFLGNSSLSYEVNLSKVLPEWVSVGFSSATGAGVEIHYILSWEFNSTKLISHQGEGAIPPMSNNGNNPPTSNKGGANIGVVIGSVVGGLVLVGGIISTLVFGWRRRRRRRSRQGRP